jgi:hypothetical protein
LPDTCLPTEARKARGDTSYEKSFLIFLLLIKLAAFGGQRLG